jgi:hypothetical protein
MWLVEALRYKLEGCRFDSQWCHWHFLTQSFQPCYVPGVNSASNRNKNQEYLLGGKGSWCILLTTFMFRLSRKLVASTSQNPLGLKRDCCIFTPIKSVTYQSER